MMTAEQFWFDGHVCKQHKCGCCDECMQHVARADAHAAAQLAEKERLYEDADKNFEEANARAEAAEERLKEAQAFVCASLGIDHDEEAGYMVIAEPEPMEAGDTFEEAIGEYVQFNNKCDEDLRERLRQREAELKQRWIAVGERLPPDTQSVLFGWWNTPRGSVVSHYCVEIGMHRSEGGYWEAERTAPQDEPIRFTDNSEQVTHWQPLPSPPKVQP